jgi:hypothetical protein
MAAGTPSLDGVAQVAVEDAPDRERHQEECHDPKDEDESGAHEVAPKPNDHP